MADKKISALTGASTPLAGTEVLPIVQGGATVKVAVSDLTAGRAVSASSLSAESASIASSSTNSTTIGLDNTAAGGRNYIIYSSGGGPAAAGTWGIYDGTAGQNRFSMDSSGNVAVGVGNLVIGASGKGVTLPGGITWTSGAGSPEGVVTAPVGSLYSRSDGGLLTSLYVKESGSGNTGWVGK
jgi:hypothetical protein